MTVVDFGWYATVLKYQDFPKQTKIHPGVDFPSGAPGFCLLKSVFLFAFFIFAKFGGCFL